MIEVVVVVVEVVVVVVVVMIMNIITNTLQIPRHGSNSFAKNVVSGVYYITL